MYKIKNVILFVILILLNSFIIMGFTNIKIVNALTINTEKNITKDKTLVLMIDFPDLKFNTLNKNDTSMYYKDFNKNHYKDMLFNKKGYLGPQGQNFISMRQYYNIQSNNTYDPDGKVMGTYTAKHKASYYGKDDLPNEISDINVEELVKEALTQLSKDKTINLAEFDQKDTEDIDNDGNIDEPNNIIDNLIIIHAGMGQEKGGGKLKDNAIASHSSKIYADNGVSPYKIPNTKYSDLRYTIQPEDGTVGVFAHEFAHTLGYKDEYDTSSSSIGAPIAWWSIMANGSDAGKIPGTEPTGFSPYAKEFFQNKYGGDWLKPAVVNLKDLSNTPSQFTLDQASIRGKNNTAVKIMLPKKETIINKPAQGKYEYFSGTGNNLNNSMSTKIDLSNCKSAKFTFKTWYITEKDSDYASVNVKIQGENNWINIPGNITTIIDPKGNCPKNSITGDSKGFKDASFDLSEFCGKKIDICFKYISDASLNKDGFYVDDIKVETDKGTILKDNAENSKSKFDLQGFLKSDGLKHTDQYYLLEWRNQTGIDSGLGNIKTSIGTISYDPGLVIWYVDKAYEDNWVGETSVGGHPGYGFLGIVDADQETITTNTKLPVPTEFQMHDAAFSLKPTSKFTFNIPNTDLTISDNHSCNNNIFKDSYSYLNNVVPSSGRYLPDFGLSICVKSQSEDNSCGIIEISKTNLANR